MPSFAYTAKDKNGGLITSTVDATDREDAAQLIVDRGLVPVTIKTQAGKIQFSPMIYINRIRKIPAMEKVVFARQFATMVSAGLPLSQALHILERQTGNEKMRAVISDISRQVEGGQSLSNALAKHANVFDKVFINMVRAGEVGGILDDVLERSATQLEKEHELKAKIKGAMTYPVVILVAMIGVFIVMMTVVIPKISELFVESGIELPLPTKILIFISKSLSTFPSNLIILIMTIGALYGLRRYVKTKKGKALIDRTILKLPIVGNLVKKIAFARFTRTLGALLASGIAVLDAIEVVAGAVGNSVFLAEMTNMATQVKNGIPMNQPLKQSKLFPPLVGQMVSVGEETGTLDKVLTKLASFYEAEVDRIVNNLSTILEPVLILIMGVAVAFLVIALILPILQLSSAF